jgi:hypothetical protein
MVDKPYKRTDEDIPFNKTSRQKREPISVLSQKKGKKLLDD